MKRPAAKRPRKRRAAAAAPSRGGLRTAKQLEKELDVSESTLARMIRDGLSPAVPSSGSAPALFDPVAVARYVRKAAAERPKAEAVWTETLQKERAREAKRRNDLAEGRLIAVDDVLSMVDTVFAALRTEFEAIERAHGTAVGDWIRQALARADASVRSRIPSPPAAAPAAPLAPVAQDDQNTEGNKS